MSAPYEFEKVMYVEFAMSELPIWQAVSVGSCFRRDIALQASPGNRIYEIPRIARAQAWMIVYDEEADEMIWPPVPPERIEQ